MKRASALTRQSVQKRMNPARWTRRQRRWVFGAVIVLCLAAVGVVLAVRGPVSPGTATMFPPTQTAPVARQVASVEPQAERLMAGWWKGHGTRPDDARFASWLAVVLPRPPASGERLREAGGLEGLAALRTSQGVVDAKWLDEHGKADVWKSLATNLPSNEQADLGDLLDFASQVASELKSQFGAPSPYVIDPSLRSDKTQTSAADGKCVCSYPSSHATASAAARAYLAHFRVQPGLLETWEAEIDYSRLYIAGHIPSDIKAGALLGDMIGQYVLITRGYETIPTAN